MKKILYIFIAVIIVVGGFYVLNGYIYWAKQGDLAGGSDYKNIAYIVSGKVIKFKNGIHEERGFPGFSHTVVTRYFGNEVFTDLDLDGREDVAFLITQTSKGDEELFYLVGALNKKEGYIGSQALYLGDRIAPQNTETGEMAKVVIVNYADRKEGDGFDIAPSVAKSLWLLLDPKTMQWGEVVQNFEGEADPARLSLTMKPWTWVKAMYGDDELIVPLRPEKFSLTLNKDEAFSASTDCNRVGGVYTAGNGKIEFKNIVSTLMACGAESQETIFIKILSDAETYRFTSKGELIFGLKVRGEAVFR